MLTYPRLQKYVRVDEANILVARVADVATIVDELPEISASPDPDDNFILATAIAGNADAVVTGDKKDLLSLESVAGVPIITVAECLRQLSARE